MRDYSESIAYGFSLYPFAIVIALGFMMVNTGPTLLQTLLSNLGVSLAGVALAGILVLQLLGTVIALAGLFGALYRVIRDAKE